MNNNDTRETQPAILRVAPERCTSSCAAPHWSKGAHRAAAPGRTSRSRTESRSAARGAASGASRSRRDCRIAAMDGVAVDALVCLASLSCCASRLATLSLLDVRGRASEGTPELARGLDGESDARACVIPATRQGHGSAWPERCGALYGRAMQMACCQGRHSIPARAK